MTFEILLAVVDFFFFFLFLLQLRNKPIEDNRNIDIFLNFLQLAWYFYILFLLFFFFEADIARYVCFLYNRAREWMKIYVDEKLLKKSFYKIVWFNESLKDFANFILFVSI